MITESEIYWITRLDGIEMFFEICAIFMTTVYVVLLAFTIFHWVFKNDKDFDENDKARYKILKKLSLFCFLPFIVFLSGAFLIPNTKEMCAIKIIPMVANQEDMKEIPADLAGLAREWIEELKPSKSTEKK